MGYSGVPVILPVRNALPSISFSTTILWNVAVRYSASALSLHHFRGTDGGESFLNEVLDFSRRWLLVTRGLST